MKTPKLVAAISLLALIAQSQLVDSPSIGAASFQLIAALFLGVSLVPIVREWLDEMIEV